ncbi:sensory neuron membrane protein 1-like [Periplaneta americana]|uniref:sensory neuron membrane protein 1-like n=1 Tax=Periplaneta americana TaxID=6978 RepID=UPI0037E8A391
MQIPHVAVSLQNLPGKWIGMSGLVMLMLGATVDFWGFGALLRNQIKNKLALKKGNEFRKAWTKFEDPIDFKIYIFNVTNPMEVQKGQKPILVEIGPYFYEEYKEKMDMKDRREDDTVSFNPRDSWVFRADKSGGLTGDEILTIPNAALLGMALTVEREKPVALQLINKAIPFIFGDPTSVFLTAPARKLLFEGVPLYCNTTNFSAKVICSELRKKEKDLHKLGEDIFGVSFFGMRNGTPGGRLTVKRGIEDIHDLGRVVAFNGQKKMTVWSGDPCNQFKGTDSTVFAPFITAKDTIAAFAPDLCRAAEAENLGPRKFKGIKGFLFNANFGDMSTDPKLKCFCTTPDTCMKKGIHDTTRCTGAPIMASLPHFLDSAPEYQDGVIGLNPSREKHVIMMILEPLTATPMVAYKRLQFSVPIHAIEKVDLMKELPTALVPILWVQEGMELDKKYLDKVRKIYKTRRLVNIFMWIVMIAGGGMGAAGAVLELRGRNPEMDIDQPPRRRKNPIEIAPIEISTPNKY